MITNNSDYFVAFAKVNSKNYVLLQKHFGLLFRWHGCVRKWIYDKFLVIQPTGEVCKKTDKINIAKEVLYETNKKH